MESIGIGTINNYCSAVTIWNLMLETDFNGSIPSNNGGQPNRPGGCQTCFGAVDLNMSDLKTIYMNSHYYMICHLSAVVRPGAIRIGTSGYTDNDIAYSAFKNTTKAGRTRTLYLPPPMTPVRSTRQVALCSRAQ